MDTSRNSSNPWVLYENEIPYSRSCDPACGVSPAEELSLQHLPLLRDAFTCHTLSDKAPRPRAGLQKQGNRQNGRNQGEREKHGMNFEEFKQTLSTVVGPDIEAAWVERFFSEVDIDGVGRVDWQQLSFYLYLEYTERCHTSKPRAALMDAQPQIRLCSHNKRQPTTRVVAVPHPPPLRYISVSKGGQLTVWNSSLHILNTLGLAGDPAEEVANRKRFRGWTTDAVCMGNFHKVVIATDCRDFHFFNVSTAKVFEDVHLFGFRAVPTALCYWYDVQSPDQPSLLIWGDEKGGVNIMRFLKPSEGLFENSLRRNNNMQRIFFPSLGEHCKLVSYRHIPNIHQEPINRVMYEPQTDLIMTSSESDTTSVVFMDVSLRREPYIWRIEQGARCFDYSRTLQMVVTGGFDRAVRLWNRYVTTRSVAAFLGHRTTVLDVIIYQPAGQIFSYSKDAELRVWDISTHHCLRTVRLQFPCLQPGLIPDQGNFPLLLLSPPLPGLMQPQLLVGCKDYLALLTVAERRRGGWVWMPDEGGELVPHNQRSPALSCALYNPTLRQVVTGYADSSLSLWDVETGGRRLTISNAHGEMPLTCMTLDSSQRRLITGARNGTIKVWDLLNGLNLHKLEPVTNSEVTGVTCLHDNHLLAVGWSRQIAQYDITGAMDVCVRADMSWKSAGIHSSDVLAVCQCPALGVVATASHDGEVIIWRLETQAPLLRLHRDTQPGVAPPVDCLLFLQHRAANRKLRHRAVLVSSQAGYLCFWSITGDTHSYGQVYAPDQAGECVLSLSSDQPENTILVSGDTTGQLQIWDISHYALDTMPKPVCERPPLLHSWKVPGGALVSVEVFGVADSLFLLTASADGSARLWTQHGDLVGSFGQEVRWNVTDPATYQWGKQNRQTEDMGEEERAGTDQSGHTGVKGQESDHADKGQTSQEECCSEVSAPPQSQTECVSTIENDHNQPQQPTHLCEDFCRKVALRRETRGAFGGVDLSKLFPVDRECAPHQALVLQELNPPEDLPTSLWMWYQSLTSGAQLGSLQMSVNKRKSEPHGRPDIDGDADIKHKTSLLSSSSSFKSSS